MSNRYDGGAHGESSSRQCRTRPVRRQPHSLHEKDAVSLAANHGEEVSPGVRVFRLEPEPVLLSGPPDGGTRFQEGTFEPFRGIPNLRRVEEAAPLDLERHLRPHGLDGIDMRVRETQVARKAQSVGQGVRQVMIVEQFQSSHTEARSCAVEVNVHGIVRDWDRPEHVIRVDVRVVIMNLLGEVGRSDWTGEQVKSNKAERALVTATVGSNERALVEAHVGLKCQGLRVARFRVGPDSAATNERAAYDPAEVGDIRLLVDVGQRPTGRRGAMVDKDRERRERRDSYGNRVWPAALGPIALVVASAQRERARAQKTGS
jgi:hypothetical protein